VLFTASGHQSYKLTFFNQESKAMISGTSNLSKRPLLGSDQLEGDGRNVQDCDEEKGCMPCSFEIVYDEEEYEESQSSSNKNEQIYIVLFVLLLFETFGMAFYVSPFRLLKADCNIILFAIASRLALLLISCPKSFRLSS
jgi:hypothetical protein